MPTIVVMVLGALTVWLLFKLPFAIIDGIAEHDRQRWIKNHEAKKAEFRERGEDYDEYLEELRLKRERDAKFKYLSGY